MEIWLVVDIGNGMTAGVGVNIVVVLNKGYDKVISRYTTVKGQTPMSGSFTSSPISLEGCD